MISNSLVDQGFLPLEREGIIYGFQAEAFPRDRVKHLFSARLGGVSKGEYDSLNLSWRRDDIMANIRENYRIACAALDLDAGRIVFSQQTHSADVAYVCESDANEFLMNEKLVPAVDALITDRPNLILTARTADCVPILLYDGVRGAIGAVHSGWKGTVGNIAARTVAAMTERFGSRPQDLLAAIGPSIGPCCFYVDEDVTERFEQAGWGEHIRYDALPKPSIDLWACCRAQLLAAGLAPEHITLSGLCTACDREHFFSHRRDQGLTGGMCAFISLI